MPDTSKKTKEAVDLTKHYKPIGSAAIRAALEVNKLRRGKRVPEERDGPERLVTLEPPSRD